MTSLTSLLGLGSAIAGVAFAPWRPYCYAAMAPLFAASIYFSHRPDSPRRNRRTAWIAFAAAVLISLWPFLAE